MKRSWLLGILLIALLADGFLHLPSILPQAPTTPVNATRALVSDNYDGDTLTLGDESRVRLLQIDTPEIKGHECYGQEAKRVLARLVKGQAVKLLEDPALDKEDRYGRLLRYVVVKRGGKSVNVNIALVRRGAAVPYFYRGERGAFADQLLQATRAAKSKGRGMWGACRVDFDPEHAAETTLR